MKRAWELKIRIRPESGKPIYIQIADALIGAIRSGQLLPGAALPGSRQLATALGVARNTLVEALELLSAEGWTVSRERSGIFVNTDLTVLNASPGAVPAKSEVRSQGLRPRIVFDDGFPDTSIAPIRELSRAYRQILERSGRRHVLGYADETGGEAFRGAMIRMLNQRRGMQLGERELLVTRGSQMGLYLAAQCLLKPGDTVAVENPGYRPAWDTFLHAGAKILPIPVDAQGLDTAALAATLRRGRKLRAVYTTPHHQFPTTVTMSLPRRLELIALSNRYGFTIIEDDYDNEFHFGQRPLLPLSSGGGAANFVYIGSMSKVLAPALRIGYLAGSEAVVARAAALRRLIDVQGDPVMEQALLQLINEGEIRRHLRRAAAHYKPKRDRFASLLEAHLGPGLSFTGPEGGLAFWISAPQELDSGKLLSRLLRKGVRIVPPERFSFDGSAAGLRLGYASLPDALLDEGVEILGRCLR